MFYLDKFFKYIFSHQVEDLKSQLVSKADMELKLVEDNRVLQQMVMRTDTETPSAKQLTAISGLSKSVGGGGGKGTGKKKWLN